MQTCGARGYVGQKCRVAAVISLKKARLRRKGQQEVTQPCHLFKFRGELQMAI